MRIFSLEHRENMSKAHKGKPSGREGTHHTEETRNKISKKNKGRQSNRKGVKLLQETKDKISKANKGKKQTEETKIKISKANSGEKHWNWKGNIKVKVNCKQCGKEKEIPVCRVKESKNNFCSYKCNTIYNVSHQNKKGTKIELLIKSELIKRNISFQPNFPILNITVVDFFIEPNIILYCDGDYWHSLKNVKDRDKKQNLILKSNGYKVFRFTETEIKKSVEKCVDKVFNKEAK